MKNFWKKKWNVVVYFVLLFMTLFFVYLASQDGENYKFTRYDQLEFEKAWNYEFSDGTSGETELPANLIVEGDAQELILTNTLPKITRNVMFMYRARHTVVKVYIDDELIYDQETCDDGVIEDTVFPLSGNVWNEMMLSPEDSEKEIKIVSKCFVLKYLSSPGEVFLGERGTFMMNLVEEKIGTIMGGIFLMLLSLILFVLWLVLSFSTHAKYNECLCLALFTLSVASWIFTETRCLQFLFPNAKAPSVLAFEILTLAPVPIALYFTYGKREKTVRLARIAAIIPLVVWIVNNTLHFTKVIDISESLIATQIMIAFETIFLGYIQVSDLNGDRKAQGVGVGGVFWWVPSLGFVMLGPLLLLEVMKYITNSTIKYKDNAFFTTVGIMFYIMSLAIHSGLKLASENFMINEANRAKSSFLANTSHDIRTPLNAILGFNELILRDSSEEKTKEYALSIKSAGGTLLDIINNILDLSKIESGKMELDQAEYSTVQLLDNVTSMISALAVKKNLTLEVEIDEKLPHCLIGDQIRIRQVLNNIMTNAVKYTKKGGVVLRVRVLELLEEEKRCKILFSVKDTGIGIKKEDQSRMFQKFERLDFEQNRNVEGTGLGMSIVVKLLEAMDSHIELKSEYGKGSEFYFVLEQQISDNSYAGAYEGGKRDHSSEEEEQYIAPEATILIVDDVALNLKVAKGLLETMKVQVDTAESGEEAIALVQRKHYDVILMDHMMPGMDGVEATHMIRKMANVSGDSYFTQVPIIALTANAISGMREMFLEEGMQDYISKPVDHKTLANVLVKWIPVEKLIRRKMISQNEAGNVTESEQTVELEMEENWKIEIPGFDIEQAKVYLLNQQMFLDTLHIFYESIPEIRGKIEKALQEQDIETYTVTVHGLKSSAKIVGATILSEEARRLESCAHNRELEILQTDTPHLLELYLECEESIAQFLKVDQAVEKVVLSKEELKESIQGLKDAAQNFNMEQYFAWEKEIETKTAPEAYANEWNKLRDAVRNVAFSDTVEVIDTLLLKIEEGN